MGMTATVPARTVPGMRGPTASIGEGERKRDGARSPVVWDVLQGVITARAITVTATTNTKVYDGTTSAAALPTITSGVLQTGDTITLAETYDTKNVGTGKTLTATATINAEATVRRRAGSNAALPWRC